MRYFLILLFILPTQSFGQNLTEKTRRAILIAQDMRDAVSLAAFLSDKNPSVRAGAAFSCASVQDTSHIEALSLLLADRSPEVRSAAGLALGQMNYVVDSAGRGRISRALVKRLGVERENVCAVRLLEALGKTGDEQSLSEAIAYAQKASSTTQRCEAALSVGRYAYRNIMNKTATEFVVDLLNTTRTGEEWKAAYALMRITDAALLAPHREQMVRFASHRHPYVRMFIAASLGKFVSSVQVVNALLSLLTADMDWRVRVNAVRSIARADSAFYPRVVPPLLQVITDSNEHVSLAALTALGDTRLGKSRFSAECRKALVHILAGKYSERQKRESAIALGKLLGVEAYPILADKFRSGLLTRESYVPALGYTPTVDAHLTLMRFAKEEDRKVRREALEALLNAAKLAHEDSTMVRLARPVFVEALQDDDMPVIATAAGALADSLFKNERSVPPLTAVLHRLKSPADSDARVAVIQALGALKSMAAVAPLESVLNDSDRTINAEAVKALEQITGTSYRRFLKPPSPPTYTNHDWNLLRRVRENPSVEVQTSKGSFTFILLPNDAPFTCINFASLINKGFFDSLLFHRVVPNFVVQGGDPRGDGWGGPGYAIRSEFGGAQYTEGTVGVASSGKDTEGCQWFVTHCNTPHLDGRYTIFGKVTSGMDVVANIQRGDRMVRIRLVK